MRKFLIIAVVVLLIGGCMSAMGDEGKSGFDAGKKDASSSSEDAKSDKPAKAAGKYDSDWPHDAGDTTCRQWRGQMTVKERFVMSADMLTAVTDELPSDAAATDFAKGITTACEAAPAMKVNEIAAGIAAIMAA